LPDNVTKEEKLAHYQFFLALDFIFFNNRTNIAGFSSLNIFKKSLKVDTKRNR